MCNARVERIGDGQVLKATIAWFVATVSGLPADFLKQLLVKVPPLAKAAVPLPGPGEVSTYLTRIGVVEPSAPVVELFWEGWLNTKGKALVEAAETDPELHFILYEASEEAAVEYLVQMAREELAKPCASREVEAFDPTIIIMLVQTLGPILMDWIRQRREKKNQPQPVPTPPPTV